MGKYIRKADRIDKERGDVLQLPKQFLEPLYSSDYPVDARRDILDALVGWFIGKEIPKLKNPLANAQLQGFINQQKEAVQSYLDLCRVNANNRAGQPNEDGATTVPQGRRPSTAVGNKSKVNVKDEQSESFTFTGGGVGRTAYAPPSPPLTATGLTVDAAKGIMHRYAPAITGENYSKEELDAFEGSDFDDSDADFLCSAILKSLNETGNKATENTVAKAISELGVGVVQRIAWRLICDCHDEAVKLGKNDWDAPETFPQDSLNRNPGKVFVYRLKEVRRAKDALDQSR